MTWSRFFWTVGGLLAAIAGYSALVEYGAGEWLGRVDLQWVATNVLLVSSIGLFFTVVGPAIRERWWSRPMRGRIVRKRLGASYFVFIGVLFLGWATYMAIMIRHLAIEREFPLSEVDRLYSAMSVVSLTMIFACFYVMIRFFRYVHDFGPETDGEG